LIRIIFSITIISTLLLSEDIQSQTEDNYLDSTHKTISDRVHTFSDRTDNLFMKAIDYLSKKDEKNKKSKEPLTSKQLGKADKLFQNDKYLDETRKSFIKLSNEYNANSIGENSFKLKLKAKLRLHKTKENINLFINGMDQDNMDEITNTNPKENEKTEIGISVLQDINKRLESKYSIGIRSFDLFVRARYTYKKTAGRWDIEPVQTFEYSFEDEFEEKTKLYFDTKIMKKVFFRTEIGRGTQSKNIGMDYNTAFSLFWTPQKKTGISLIQNFSGNTEYKYISNDTIGEKTKFTGINNYSTQITFRQSVFREWIFYELNPGVNFHKDNDFDPNYSFSARLEFFFGGI